MPESRNNSTLLAPPLFNRFKVSLFVASSKSVCLRNKRVVGRYGSIRTIKLRLTSLFQAWPNTLEKADGAICPPPQGPYMNGSPTLQKTDPLKIPLHVT